MTPAWAQRQEELLSDYIVSPDVFNHMVERLEAFVVPYQHALETEAGKRNVHLYLQGLLSHVPRKNVEAIATLVDVERLVLQEFIGTVPWDYRPLVRVLVRPTVCPSVASRNLLLYQSLPISIPYRYALLRRRKDDTDVGTASRGIVRSN
jgi:hypothetical protein